MRLSEFESRMKAAFEMAVIHGLAEITDNPIPEDAAPNKHIRVRCNENHRDVPN